MPTYTSNYNLAMPLVNNATDQDLWGGYLNTDISSIDTLLRSGICTQVQSSQTSGFSASASISIKYLYPCDTTSGGFSVSIPAAATAGNGAQLMIIKTSSDSNLVTLNRSSSDTLGGATSLIIKSRNGGFNLISDGVSSWNIQAPPAFTGDSGSGGYTGMVPAPASGDAAANKFLKASGDWTALNPQLFITAWARFNGTSSSPITPTSGVGISSITKNGTGYYSPVFTSSLANANYAVIANSSPYVATRPGGLIAMFSDPSWNNVAPTTAGFSFVVTNDAAGRYDPTYCFVAVLGGV